MWVDYEALDGPCASGPKPGTAALAAALLDTFADDDPFSPRDLQLPAAVDPQ